MFSKHMHQTVPESEVAEGSELEVGYLQVRSLGVGLGVGRSMRHTCRLGLWAVALMAVTALTGVAVASLPMLLTANRASPTSGILEEAITTNETRKKKKKKATMVDYELDYNNSGWLNFPNLTAQGAGWPSLFCWCIMLTVGTSKNGWMEELLIKHQLLNGIGIFACNEWAVMSDVALTLNRWGAHGFPLIPGGEPGPLDMPTWAIGSTKAVKGIETNPLNTGIFRTAWSAIRSSGRLDGHDWLVKVDPDAVWFPKRLRTHLKAYMPGHGSGWENVYLQNCLRFQSMQGPIEVLSKRAAMTLEKDMKWCGGFWGTGEDQFIVRCLRQLGVAAHMESTLLNDKYCDGYIDCHDTWKVAFHPHKNAKNFIQCYNTSATAELNQNH